MIYLYLTIAAIAPILLIATGKRFLGSATHPAAIFILAWMLCGFLLSLAKAIPFSRGVISFAWVAICFAIITLVQKRRASSKLVKPNETEGENKST